MYDLDRFVSAQNPVYEQVCRELRAGRKTSHWMWFVFPQIAGLGMSPMAQRYAIVSRAEAKAYAAHAILGARLRECTRLVLAVENRTLRQIFVSPDDMKFKSSMTLFARAADDNLLFVQAIEKYCGGLFDERTIDLSGDHVD